MSQKKEIKLGDGCLALFGLPFFLMGFAFFLWGLSMVNTWHKSQDWDRVPAKIISADMKTHHDSDGNTYSLKGEYKYTYKGKEYIGDRVQLETGSSSAYDEKKQLLNRMQQAIKNETPIEAYVDPDNPEESILFRQISMGMILITGVGLLFTLVGLGLIASGIFAYRKSKQKDALLEKFPGKPWKADSRWSGFKIITSQLNSLIAKWAFSLFFSIFVSIFLFLLYGDKSAPWFAWGIIGLFAVFAVLSIFGAIYKTLGYLKYGESQMVLHQIPLVPGAEFKGVIVLPKGIGSGKKVDLEFFCEKCLTTGSGKHRSTKTTVLHKEKAMEITDSRKRINERFIVPVAFTIPENGEPDSPSTNPTIEWKLKAVAEVPGVDYEAVFSLPVFKVNSEEDIEYKT
ncbi:MAG: DUF3592 domain-containing protein [Candidatus Rifleibacteriota bacterium]